MNLKDRRVCVCMKCFNLEEKMRSINQMATKCKTEPLTLRSMYKNSVCDNSEEFPDPKCIDNSCSKCNDKLQKKYELLVQEKGLTVLKYVQWEQVSQKYTNSKGECQVKKVWQQMDHSGTLSSIFDSICSDMTDFKGHMFRNDYQYTQHQRLAKDLPEDHAIVYADFSQNYAMEANDEIQTAHYVKRQVTLHTMYLVRHAKSSTRDNPQLTKEAIAIISDDLKHSASAVYVYTIKLLSYMRDNPEKVGLPKVLHRITDNCGFEYKCKQAFAHLLDYENVTGVKVLYHYSEPGHGKGPHDGIGATIKHGLDMLVVQDRVRLRNSYEVYLAATKYLSTVGKNADPSTLRKTEFSKRKVLYVPAKVSRSAPNEGVKPVPGTMKLRFLQNISSNNVETANLSCSCPFCLLGTGDHCEYGKWRKTAVHKIRSESTEHADTSKLTETDTDGLKQSEVVASLGDGLTEVINESITSFHQQESYSASALHTFEAKVYEKGWQVRGDTPADGNCLFWAVSDQLDETGFRSLTHKQLRNNAVAYIRDLTQREKKEITHFLTRDLDNYLQEMERDGTYADHIIIDSVAKFLGCVIKIVQADHADININSESGAASTLIVGYLPESKHYLSLETRSFKPDDFVAVYLSSSRKKKHFYVAKVIEIDDAELKLRFLTETRPAHNIYTWPNSEDVCWVPKKEVGRVLLQPELTAGRGIRMKFNESEMELCRKYVHSKSCK